MAIKFFAFFFRQSVLSDVFGLNAPAVWAQRCGAGGCRREATWIYRWSYGCTYTEMHSYLIHTHTDTMRIDPETPRRFPKPSSVLSLGPFLLLTGETVRECAVWRGQWMGIGDVAIFSEVEWPLHPSIYIMVYSQCFRGVQDVKTGLLIYTTSLAK